jgi:hypothetical protein
MKRGYENAPYESMGTKRPPRPLVTEPVREDEFMRGKEAGPEPRPAPKRDIMIPTPEEEMKMRRQVEDEKMLREMDKSYQDASRRSMRLAKGGSVSSASKRADGIAQRGKTRGKYL